MMLPCSRAHLKVKYWCSSTELSVYGNSVAVKNKFTSLTELFSGVFAPLPTGVYFGQWFVRCGLI